MAHGPRYNVPFRRRREGRTNYRKRRALLKSRLPRAVVRRSLKYFTVQFIEFDPIGDRVLVSATSKELKKYGWTANCDTTPAAYLTGYLAGKRALSKGIDEAVLDIGLAHPHPGGRLFSALKGMLDAGVWVPSSEEVLPAAERIRGEHLGEKTPPMFAEVREKIAAEFPSIPDAGGVEGGESKENSEEAVDEETRDETPEEA